MSVEMDKPTSTVERPNNGDDLSAIIEQARSKIQECLGRVGTTTGTATVVKAPVTVSSNGLKADIDAALLNIRRQVESHLTAGKTEEKEDKTTIKVEETSVKMEEEDRASVKVEEKISMDVEVKEDRASVKVEEEISMEVEVKEDRASVKMEEETAVKVEEKEDRASLKVETSVKMEEDKASIKVEEISMKMESQEASVTIDQVGTSFIKEVESSGNMEEEKQMKELLAYFTALEEDRRNLQNLLQECKGEHEMQLKALERERIQQRVEREGQVKEREEALLSALKSAAIGKQKLMADLRNQLGKQSLTQSRSVSAVRGKQPKKWWCFKKQKASPDAGLQSATHLGGVDGNPPVVSQERQSRKWWSFKKRQATTDVAVQEASTSSASKDAKEADLQKIRKLEEQVRKAELKKQQKAAEKAAEAEKKAKKAEEEREKKEAKRAAKKGKPVKDNNLADHAGPSGVSNTGVDQ